jgi:flagellin-like hook-associated protein FlgL
MRISTRQIYTQGIEAFQQQQQKLAKLQEQISSGVRLNNPSDDSSNTRLISTWRSSAWVSRTRL